MTKKVLGLGALMTADDELAKGRMGVMEAAARIPSVGSSKLLVLSYFNATGRLNRVYRLVWVCP